MLKVSIITPVYNGAKFIEQTINSVLNQSYPQIQYIIVDGGSTDNTVPLIKKYENQLYYWDSLKDNGMYSALNRGFSKADGDIYYYLNSDDLLYDDNVISEVVHCFEKKKCDFLYGNTVYIDVLGNELYRYKAVYLTRKMILALGRLPFAQQSCFWRSYHHIPFDEDLKYVADSKLFLSILQNNERIRIEHLRKYLGRFRLHKTSFTISHKKRMQTESMAMKTGLYGKIYQNTFLKCISEVYFKLINFSGIVRKLTIPND